MRLPKYKFYLGKSIRFDRLTVGQYIDDKTGEYTDYNNSVATDKLPVDSDTVFVNYDVAKDKPDTLGNMLPVEDLVMYMYDTNKKYIGFERIDKSGVYALENTTKYIAFCFLSYTADKYYEHVAFAENNFTEAYSIHTITPHYKTLSKKYAKQNNQKFFRESLDGKINLFGNDYEYIKNSSIEDILSFFITKLDTRNNAVNAYYKSIFNKTDCKLDYDKCSCELKLTTLDAYTSVLDKYEDTYDLIKLAPALSRVNIYKRSLVEIYVKGSNVISNFHGGTYWEDDVNTVINSHDDLISKYHFAYLTSGNEFRITESDIKELNGVYAGTSGVCSNTSGYTTEMVRYFDGQIDYTDLYITRVSDRKRLYKCSNCGAHSYDPDINYISQDQLRFYRLDDKGNATSEYIASEYCFTYHVYQRLLCDVSSIKIGASETTTYDLPSDDFVIDHRNYKKCIGYKTGTIICSSATSREPTRFGVNDYDMYFTNDFVFGTGLQRIFPISRNSWANASLWFTYTPFNRYDVVEKALRKKYTIKHCFPISGVIKALLRKINPTISHEATEEYSQFLYGSKSPLATELNRFQICITPKSNILKGNYDQPAKKAEVTFKTIMEMLRDCFRCYWYIEDNMLKIEHIKFFMNGGSYTKQKEVQFDFTKLKDQFNKKLTGYFQSNLEFDKSELSSRYEFAWMDDATELFSSPDVDVTSNYVQKDKKEDINVGQFSADVDYMLFDPNNFSSDGFALLCAVKNGYELELPIVEVQMLDEDKLEYTATVQNFYASWKYLLRLYMYDMPAANISVKEGLAEGYEVRGIKKCAKQTITFPAAEDPNSIDLMTTNFGNGEVDEMKINIDTRLATVNLIYEPF